MITDDQKARIVELYASGESTLKVGRILQLPRLIFGCIAPALTSEGRGKPRRSANFATMHSMN